MIEQLEGLKPWCPLAGCIIGMLIAESDLPFFPWGILALILVGLSTVYVLRTTFGTRPVTVTRYRNSSEEEEKVND